MALSTGALSARRWRVIEPIRKACQRALLARNCQSAQILIPPKRDAIQEMSGLGWLGDEGVS